MHKYANPITSPNEAITTTVGGPIKCGSYSADVRYCAGEIVWHNIDPSIVAGFYIVRVPGIVRVNFRDTYPHYIGPPTVSD